LGDGLRIYRATETPYQYSLRIFAVRSSRPENLVKRKNGGVYFAGCGTPRALSAGMSSGTMRASRIGSFPRVGSAGIPIGIRRDKKGWLSHEVNELDSTLDPDWQRIFTVLVTGFGVPIV
jgi:hypothetical protein